MRRTGQSQMSTFAMVRGYPNVTRLEGTPRHRPLTLIGTACLKDGLKEIDDKECPKHKNGEPGSDEEFAPRKLRPIGRNVEVQPDQREDERNYHHHQQDALPHQSIAELMPSVGRGERRHRSQDRPRHQRKPQRTDDPREPHRCTKLSVDGADGRQRRRHAVRYVSANREVSGLSLLAFELLAMSNHFGAGCFVVGQELVHGETGEEALEWA